MNNSTREKIEFCAKYLLANGVDAAEFERLAASIPGKKIPSFEFVKQDVDFFTEVAQGLWNLWPKGNKDDKHPWKDSVPMLVKRLIFIWDELEVTESFTVDDCLEAGRRYLAQFEHNDTKYMRLLKYFIFKQKDMGVKKNGMYVMQYESTLISFLRNKDVESEFQIQQDEEDLV